MSRNRRKRRQRRQKQRQDRAHAGHSTRHPAVTGDSSSGAGLAALPAKQKTRDERSPAPDRAGSGAQADRGGRGPATLALSYAAAALLFVFVADLGEFCLTAYLDSPTDEYFRKFLQRHWREVAYGVPFLSRYLGAGAGLAALVYLALVARRFLVVRLLLGLPALVAVLWFFLRGASYASLNVQLNTTLLQYVLENGALIFAADGADVTSSRVPLAIYAYGFLLALPPLLFLFFGRDIRPGPERLHRWQHGLATLCVLGLSGALALVGGDGLAATIVETVARDADARTGRDPAGIQAAAWRETLRVPDPARAVPATFPFEDAFRRRYGFYLKPDTNLVVFFLESARAAYVPLEATRYFKPDDRKVVAVDQFFVPVPHSSNSHYSLFTGMHSARKAKDKFDLIEPERSLPGLLSARGHAAYYLYGGDANFDDEDELVANLGMRLVHKKDLRKKRDEKGRRLYKEFWWGVDDRALLDETRAILKRESGPLMLTVVYTNSHHPYLNYHPDRYNQFDNETDRGRHRNAIRYALDLSDMIVDEFEKQGRARDTLFIMLSDHGESFGEHGFILHDFSLYNTEVRIPFAMRHPDFRRLFDRPRFPAGTILDVFPTVADLMDLEFPGEIHGRSLFARDYSLRLLLRAWGSDDYVGLIDGARKWLYSRPRREFLRMNLDDGEPETIEVDRPARAFIDAMYARSFGDIERPEEEDEDEQEGEGEENEAAEGVGESAGVAPDVPASEN